MGRLQDEQNTAPGEAVGADDLAADRGEAPSDDTGGVLTSDDTSEVLSPGGSTGLGGGDSGEERFREVEYRDVERTGPEDAGRP